MVVKIVREFDVELRELPGRDLKNIISKNNVGAEEMVVNIVWLKPGDTVKPCHSHPNAEELFYILNGKGKCFVDGNVLDIKSGDFLFLPKKSKHMLRNTGKKVLKVLCIITPPTSIEDYEFHPEIKWAE